MEHHTGEYRYRKQFFTRKPILQVEVVKRVYDGTKVKYWRDATETELQWVITKLRVDFLMQRMPVGEPQVSKKPVGLTLVKNK